jgi:hypothetical protein
VPTEIDPRKRSSRPPRAWRTWQRYLEGMQIVREIVVPGKLVNLVVKPQP